MERDDFRRGAVEAIGAGLAFAGFFAFVLGFAIWVAP